MNNAKVDLHLHLDGSLNIRWAYDKALEKKVVPSNTTFEEFYNILFAKNFEHSAISITKFQLLCDILQDYQSLYEASYDLAKRSFELGLIYAEIRFASQQHTDKGLSQLDALQAVIDGAKKAQEDYPIKIGVINCLMHKGDSALFNDAQNIQTVLATKELFGKGAVGLDLAGYENNCDYKEYAYLTKMARDLKIPYTMHAGEMGDETHINDAMDMGAYRLGHGVNCVKDEKILQRVIDSQIPLEVCVTSNIKTTLNYASHPIRTLIEKGANVTINTDNMIFAKTTLVNEHNQLKMLGVSEETLLKCQYNAIEASFTDEDTKTHLKTLL